MIRTYTYNTFTYIFMQHVVHIPRNVVLGIQIKNKFPPYPPTSLFLIISYIHPLRFSSTSTSLPPLPAHRVTPSFPCFPPFLPSFTLPPLPFPLSCLKIDLIFQRCWLPRR